MRVFATREVLYCGAIYKSIENLFKKATRWHIYSQTHKCNCKLSIFARDCVSLSFALLGSNVENETCVNVATR